MGEMSGSHWFQAESPVRPRADDRVYDLMKRLLDLTVSGLILLALSPLLIVLAMAIELTSPGSVLFRQKRVGMNGRTFWIYKFRTMSPSPSEVSDIQWTVPQDTRVTPLGRFLRQTSLDELPQFLNVLRGEMSLVGPRPERPHYVNLFSQIIPGYAKRLSVKCGMTGWAQVNGWRGNTSIQKRLDHDLYYLQNRSLWLDLKILLLTLVRGFNHPNAY